MTMLTRIAQLTIRVTGPAQVVLGVLFWFGFARGPLPVHKLVGLLFTLALLTLTALAARAGLHAGLVALSAALVLLIPVLGIVQGRILPGEWHWTVRAAHLAIGFVAMAVAARLGRFIRSRASVGGELRTAPATTG